MIMMPMDIAAQYPVRKTKKQKTCFLNDIMQYAESQGYKAVVERSRMGVRNLVIGDPGAPFLICAHYDTCARLPFPNFITPKNLPIFVLYQLLVAAVILIPVVAVQALSFAVMDSMPGVGMLLELFSVVLCFAVCVLMMAGPANPSNANDNTSGVVAVLEMVRSLPANQRNKVCFVLFDLEEAGLFGSSFYRKKHKKETEKQLVLNFDCVGDGDEIYLFPNKKVLNVPQYWKLLKKCNVTLGTKTVTVHEKGFAVYPSDQKNFPYGVGICALNRRKNLLYMSRIHTPKDTVLDETNINILRACIISMIAGAAEE